jgi:hypothetical protein
MKRIAGPIAVSALGIAGLAMPAYAVTTVSSISGSMGSTQETCLQQLTTSVSDGENCMYDGGPSGVPAATPFGETTGPYNHIVYYDSLATPAAFQSTMIGSARVLYTPVNGDGKMSQSITGSVTIDDGGNGYGAGDLISFTLTLTSSGGGDIIRHYGASVIEKYSSMTQILAPTAASSATANGLGGFDYVIGSEGFPSLLTFSQAGVCLGVAFGSVECGHSFAPGVGDPDYWTGSTTAGLGSLEGNQGGKTTGSVSNLACIDSASATGVESNDCRDSQVAYSPYLGTNGACAVAGLCVVGGARGASEDVGWDELLLRVSTDALGNVVSLAGFNVDDYRVFGSALCGDNTTADGSSGSYSANCNAWTSSYFTASAVVPVPAAVWLMGSALGLLGWIRRKAA